MTFDFLFKLVIELGRDVGSRQSFFKELSVVSFATRRDAIDPFTLQKVADYLPILIFVLNAEFFDLPSQSDFEVLVVLLTLYFRHIVFLFLFSLSLRNDMLAMPVL